MVQNHLQITLAVFNALKALLERVVFVSNVRMDRSQIPISACALTVHLEWLVVEVCVTSVLMGHHQARIG